MRYLICIALALLGFSGLAMARPHSCDKQVMAKLTQLGVAASQIKTKSFIEVRDGSIGARLIGYEAWIELDHCRGNVVLNMSPECSIQQAYTKGTCKIEGLKSYR